jgi:hypothetical protein
MLPLATIRHPTDFSEHSEFAFRLACALARDYDARLNLLHVISLSEAIYGGTLVPEEKGPGDEGVKESLRKMENSPGLSLLLSNRLSECQRRAAGWALLLVGALSTVPLALEVFGRRCASIPVNADQMENAPRSNAEVRLDQPSALAWT